MRLGFGLHQTQVQKQALAPRMIQSMEILQLPILALQERIDQEVSENPILEVQEVDPTLPEEQVETEKPDALSDQEKELVVDNDTNNTDDFERLLDLDREVPDHFDETPRKSVNRVQEESDRKHDAMANAEARQTTLSDYLLEQLAELGLEPDLHHMCERIISTLDPASGGYFKMSLRDLLPPNADESRLALAERALQIVQECDPAGIAARDLRECLLNQLTLSQACYDELKIIIENHLEDLRDNRLPLIERKTGLSVEQINLVWEELRKLNPKPGARFSDAYVPTVTPDIRIELGEDGTYKVVLDDYRIPTLRISKYYRERLANGQATPEEKEFIKRKINSAQWLIESIEQRRSTLTRVAQAIVDYQQRFLIDGPEFIQPLKMQQIADQVGVHVTTVSRAVDDKWIETPRGILALRKFFVGGSRGEDGDDVAWDRIRIKLQEVVDKEDKQHPLSDDDLVKALKKHGMNVARRTITKYRQKMGIPSSRQRRDWSNK